jgi:translation elongation factor EF-G
VIKQSKAKKKEKMIEFCNAIDKVIINNNYKYNKNSKKFKMLGIAHLNLWHGYDRVISGIYNYNGDKNLQFDIVSSETTKIKRLKKLIKRLKIDGKVNFLGEKNIEEIKNLVDEYDIGIGGLNYWDRNGKYDTSIKNKEYCAFGLPFIISLEDKSFPQNFEYFLKVSADNKPLNLEKIISWYESFKDKDYKKDMINYAKNRLTYDKKISKILTVSDLLDNKELTNK